MTKEQLQAMNRCRKAQANNETAKTVRMFELNEAIKSNTFEVPA